MSSNEINYIEQKFNGIFTSLNTYKLQLSSLQQQVKMLEKHVIKELNVGDQVEISGGYDYEIRWFKNIEAGKVQGIVRAIFGKEESKTNVIVELPEKIKVDDFNGKYLVLSARYEKQENTETSGTVHLELCDFYPESKSWEERKHGEWIESHAYYKRIK